MNSRPGSSMNVSPEHLIQQARERFAMQDYRGAAFLLEEVVAGGRAFADVHHLLGVSYSLLSLPAKALVEFDRALALNPRYLEALIHRGMILMDLGRREDGRLDRSHAGVDRILDRFGGVVRCRVGRGAGDLAHVMPFRPVRAC